MKSILLTLFLTTIMCSNINAAKVVKGVLGDTNLGFRANIIKMNKSLRLPVDMKEASLICIREVYPDAIRQPRYLYDVLIDGRLVYKRDYTGTGFGLVSCFVQIPAWAQKSKDIKIINKGNDPILLINADSILAKDLNNLEQADKFGLLGMVPWSHGPQQAKAWINDVSSKIPVKSGFYKGYSTEFYFARWPEDRLEEQMVDSLKWAHEYHMAFLPMMVSWWSGTPMEIPDGKGGTFGDIKYQQICWSPEHNIDDTPQLKELLGDRWNIHYCLSIPNEWSDTPWLTMNSPELNAYRHKTLDQSIRMLSGKIKAAGQSVLGLCLDNEPRYWDTACEAGNPKRDLITVWGDFNPYVIRDARKADIDLDPSNGLDSKERMWLHRNVARYNQNTVNQALKTLNEVDPKLADHVYTHSLQLVGFPGDAINHTMSEWAYSKGAKTGIEGFWMKMSDLDRVREWGLWANVNREETDGVDLGMHLWDLRLTYARGGQFYNSYNWYGIGFSYMHDFLDEFPSAKIKEPNVESNADGTATFMSNLGIQSINRIIAQVNLSDIVKDALIAEVRSPAGRILGFARAEGPFRKGTNKIQFVFSNPADLLSDTLGVLNKGTLSVYCEKDNPIGKVVIQNADLWFDLRRERTQSLWVIANSK